MPYLEQTTENDWCKRLFDSLRTIESKLDQLLVMKEQSVDTTIHPPLKPEYRRVEDSQSRAENHLQLGMGRKDPISQSEW